MEIKLFYQRWGILLCYIIAFLSILISVAFDWSWFMLVPIALFFYHDLNFRIDSGKTNFLGRSYAETVESIRAASNYISYFIALIGVFVGIIIGNDDGPGFFEFMKQNGWLLAYSFIIIAFSGIALLFIPVQYKDPGETDKPSESLKNCFFAVLFFEKIIILLLVYLLLEIGKHFFNF